MIEAICWGIIRLFFYAIGLMIGYSTGWINGYEFGCRYSDSRSELDKAFARLGEHVYNQWHEKKQTEEDNA